MFFRRHLEVTSFNPCAALTPPLPMSNELLDVYFCCPFLNVIINTYTCNFFFFNSQKGKHNKPLSKPQRHIKNSARRLNYTSLKCILWRIGSGSSLPRLLLYFCLVSMCDAWLIYKKCGHELILPLWGLRWGPHQEEPHRVDPTPGSPYSAPYIVAPTVTQHSR